MAYGSLALLKAMTKIPSSDSTKDPLLQYALDSATELINKMSGRDFTPSSASATARVFTVPEGITSTALIIDDVGDVTGLAVEAGGPTSFTAIAASGYYVGPDNAIALGRPVWILNSTLYAWSAASASVNGVQQVRVTARWGWPATPASITQAALIQANRIFKRQDSPEGIAGSAEWGIVRLGRTDPDVAALVAPYCRPGFA